ncbi:hypothetical protein [Emticicia aquatilis]|nr:hypothetical protein [Emticicia aquatilis]
MELLVDTVESNEISVYEKERGKPLPTYIHGAIQSNLLFELRLKYQDKLRVLSEVTLATQPLGSTPDLLLYPQQALDY